MLRELISRVRKGGLHLRSLENEALTEEEYLLLVREALRQNGTALEYVSNEKQIFFPGLVLCAVLNIGQSIHYAHRILQSNKSIVLAAVLKDPLSLSYASNQLKEDSQLISLAGIIDNERRKEYFLNMSVDEIPEKFLQFIFPALKPDRDVFLSFLNNDVTRAIVGKLDVRSLLIMRKLNKSWSGLSFVKNRVKNEKTVEIRKKISVEFEKKRSAERKKVKYDGQFEEFSREVEEIRRKVSICNGSMSPPESCRISGGPI